MKKIVLTLVILTLSILTLVSVAFSEESKIQMLNLDGTHIMYIQDSPGFMPKDFFNGITEQEWARVTKEKSIPAGVNVFLFQLYGDIVMVDAGNGGNVGKLAQSLEVQQIKPEDVKHILLTHLHGDHFNGLIKDDTLYFKNAKYYINQIEYDTYKNDEYVQRILKIIPAENLVLFNYGDEVLKNVKAIDLSGHTPGHTGFYLKSNKTGVVMVGDILHALDLQVKYPKASIKFDSNPEQAVKTRLAFFEQAATNGWYLLGAHFPFPNPAKIEKIRDDEYGLLNELVDPSSM